MLISKLDPYNGEDYSKNYRGLKNTGDYSILVGSCGKGKLSVAAITVLGYHPQQQRLP